MLTMHGCRDVDGSPAKRPRVGPAEAGLGGATAGGGGQAEDREDQAPSAEMGQAEHQVRFDHVVAAGAVRLATHDTWQHPCWMLWVMPLT